MFCGLLPWTWFSASLLEAAGSLISGGNLIKKVLFPAEVLPIVSVLSNMVHFFLGLLILAGFMIGTQHFPDPGDLIFFPLVVLIQLIFTLALSLILSALTVHFRDIRDLLANLLTFWFFATPIIYFYRMESVAALPVALRPQPVLPPLGVVPGDPLLPRSVRRRSLQTAAADGRGLVRALSVRLLAVRSAARLLCRGGMSLPAIELSHVTKIYRRYGGRHFATLKSALLQRSILRDLQPQETFQALNDVSFAASPGSTIGVIGRNGSGKSTALKLVAGITKPTSGTVTVRGRISALIELGAGFHPEISGRENVFINGIMLGLSKREIQKRFDEIVEFAELQEFIDAPVKSYSSGMYMRLGIFGRDSRRSRSAAGR